jgi:nucleotide-binding universal stress UspA family protein
MYASIYAPLDNSDHSNTAMRYAVELGRRFEARVTGSHVYAAALHDVRFKQMEFTLPDEYKEENELEKQRRIHDALITRGLQLISDSYLAPMAAMAEDAGVELEGKTFDGKNFEEIAKDIDASDYDLVILGALGLGAVKQSKVGSVCERVLRRSDVDTLVIRDPEARDLEGEGAIVVALDGSSWSWGGLKTACSFAEMTGRSVEIVAVHAPGAGSETLLDAHVSLARQVVRSRGIKVRTATLDGHAAEAISNHLDGSGAWLLVVGRHGLDVDNAAPEIGTVTEDIVRRVAINVLVTASEWRPELQSGLASQQAA